MGPFSFPIKLIKYFIRNRLPTRQLTYINSRVRYYIPELPEEMAFLVAAKLYLQPYLKANTLTLTDLAIAHQMGLQGFCGVTLTDLKRHDYDLHQDQTSKLVRWVMQMEYLLLSVDLKLASPEELTDLLIQSKPAIIRDVDKTLTGNGLKETTKTKYNRLIEDFSQSPTYNSDLEQIRYAINRVQRSADD